MALSANIFFFLLIFCLKKTRKHKNRESFLKTGNLFLKTGNLFWKQGIFFENGESSFGYSHGNFRSKIPRKFKIPRKKKNCLESYFLLQIENYDTYHPKFFSHINITRKSLETRVCRHINCVWWHSVILLYLDIRKIMLTVMTPEIRQKKGLNWRAEPVLVSQKIVGAE